MKVTECKNFFPLGMKYNNFLVFGEKKLKILYEISFFVILKT